MHKGVPIGIRDFGKVRELGFYFVDKSLLIDQIFAKNGVEAFLFTRSHKFGKSLDFSMLDAYMNMKYSRNTWFDGLQIGRLRPDNPEKNSSPVIRFDTKEFKSRSYDVFVSSVRPQTSGIFSIFMDLVDSEVLGPRKRMLFDDILNMKADEATLSKALRLLSDMLHAHYGRKVVILVDEYDSSVNGVYGTQDQRTISEFTRDFLSSALKGDDSLKLTVVTGVMQIAKESIFSGLNLKMNNILSTDMDEMFGFTSFEVERLCSDFGRAERFQEARGWYDGYRLGNADIYNPWSILNYIDERFKPGPYWAGTNENSIIDDLLSVPDREIYDNLLILGFGGGSRQTWMPR